MAAPLEHVRPGDLITALAWNTLVDKLNDVNTRLIELENAGGGGSTDVAITELIPDGVLTSGDDLEIRGRNFDYSRGAQRVYFNATPVSIFRDGSSDTRLLIQIPNVPAATEAGTQVTLLVTNPTSSTSRQVTLKRAPDQQQGNVALNYQSVNPLRIVAGSQVTFTYSVSSQTLLPVVVTIAPTISLTSVQNSLQILNPDGTTIVQGRLSLNSGETKLFLIRIPTFPNLADNTPFTMQVAASGTGIGGDQDGPREFRVNVASEPVDTKTTLDIESAVPPSALVENKTKLRLARTSSAIVKLEIGFTEAGSYNFIAPTHAQWNIQPSDENPAPPFNVSGVPSGIPLDFIISPKTTASGTVRVTFTVQRQVGGTTLKRTADLNLEVTS
jgi:hypothetical protein